LISKYLKRNSDKRSGLYKADLANIKYKRRQKEKHKYRKFTLEMQTKIEALLKEDYSPEQFVGFLSDVGEVVVSIERIYQHIWIDKAKGGTLYLGLRRQSRKYRKRGSAKDSRGTIKNRISIDKRPSIVEKKERFGDLEVDLIMGEHHQQAILTINYRVSGMLKMKKVESKQAKTVTKAINELLEEWIHYTNTITADNGKEFAGHQTVAEELNIDFYFAHPYHSWERGANENLNGLVRQYFKKGSSFKAITKERIQEVENKLNNRPRKRFEYKNPIFVMSQLLFNQKLH
jgi:IS30 family transposase